MVPVDSNIVNGYSEKAIFFLLSLPVLIKAEIIVGTPIC